MQAISEVVKSSNAKSGTVIVMNPKTGEVLAQATYPTYDPANTKILTQANLKIPR